MKLCPRLLVLSLLVLPCLSAADDVDRLVEAEMKRQGIVGAAVAVVRDGKPAKMRGYGLANIELNVPVTQESVFKLASISKQFIAAGAMLLVQDGKLSLDDTLAKHFSDSPDEWKTITIRHLLTHTSGLQRELPGWSGLRVYSDDELLEMAKGAKCGFEPGEKYEYCNTGYFLTSLIISKQSGMPWPQFLEERLFRPLGMTATRTTTLRSLVTHRVDGYERDSNGYQNPTPLIGVRPSGALISSLPDLVKWERELLTPKILSQTTLEQMWTPVRLNDGKTHGYGLGLQISELQGKRVIEHSGSLAGFRTHYLRLPDVRLAVIVLTNTSSANPGQLARRIAEVEIAGATPASLRP
jgi:D-alanyl-D-alanine carboxypeptidase